MKIFKGKIFFVIAYLFLLVFKADAEDFKIGASLALSGEGAVWGVSAQRGIELAVKEINSKGGIKGRPVSVSYGDFRSSDLKIAVQNAKRFISIDKVDAILTQWSGDSQVILPISKQSDLITLCIGPASDELGKKFPVFARLWPSDKNLVEPLVDYAIENNYIKPIVIGTSDPYFANLTELTKFFWQAKKGVELHVKEIDSSNNEVASIALAVKNYNPDLIIIHTPYNIEGTLINRIKELNITAPIIESQKSDDQAVLSVAGKNAEGIIFPEYENPTNEYQEKFKKEFHVKPVVPSEYAYDAVMLLANIFNKDENNLTKDLINSIRTTKDFEGASGVFSIDKSGNRLGRKVNLMVIENGKAEIIDTK